MIGDILSCKLCGNKFTAKSHNAMYCSKNCKQKVDKDRRMKRNIFSYFCTECGAEITGRYKKKNENVFCNAKCRINYYKRNSKKIKCVQCGKEFESHTAVSLYCSESCKLKHKKENPPNNNYKCFNCGKDFYRSEKQRGENIFCGRKCYFEHHRKVNTVNNICEICGHEFTVTNRHSSQRFCSVKCQGKWQSKTLVGDNANSREYKMSDYGKIKMAESMVERLSTGDLSLTDSLPQKVVNAILYKNGIDYVNEYNIKYYLIDNYIQDKNLFIEVMGDYWHCNPEKYQLIKNKVQKSNITRDKRKHSFVLNKYDCEILYIWEKDVYDNPDLCEKLMLEYINNDGVLDDYNSFNYSIEENELIFKDKIIQPYLSYDIDKLNSVCEYINSHN